MRGGPANRADLVLDARPDLALAGVKHTGRDQQEQDHLEADAVALLKQFVHREKTGAERGTLLVLIDRSASMNVPDAHRSHAQLIALADVREILDRQVQEAWASKPRLTLIRPAPAGEQE